MWGPGSASLARLVPRPAPRKGGGVMLESRHQFASSELACSDVKEATVRTFRGAVLLALIAGLLAGPARAADPLKIGFITSLSGPAGVIGKHMKDSVELALDHLGRKVGGMETEVIYGDDQRKPDVGKQLADEMLKKHKVNF